MTEQEYNKTLAAIKAQEKKLGVTIEITDIIDKDHLNCTWYGGEVGRIIGYKGYTIVIGAYGDIRLTGRVNGEYVDIKDKSNGGSVYNELGSKLDDAGLAGCLNNAMTGEDDENMLEFDNNNWFEVDLIGPDGKWIDLCGADNVLDDDLLGYFKDVEEYFQYVDWAIENRH